ncbi:TonB family protein [Novosphingobium sp. ZW T3_23]|uniref:TonB family protein n=1 Tax=Novosphingobium sp. ZW T3_23 TaxID=3378084 RepID=UPI0038528458
MTATSAFAYEVPSRYCDRPLDWRARLFGVLGTGTLCALSLGIALFAWHKVQTAPTPSEPVTVTVQPLAAPSEQVEEVPEGPRQVEQRQVKPQQQERPPSPEIVIPRLAPASLPGTPPVEEAKPAPPVAETTAPRSLRAPPAREASSARAATWEALLLAHLEKYRRYPSAARGRREEGVAYVVFRMNRAGAVLSAAILRSSHSAVLDRAALETLRRAQPLPEIPEDMSDPLELSVPVEFFIHPLG